MSDTQNVYIYLKQGEVDYAYMLKKGKVIIELNRHDSFEISGNNIIFGISEIFLTEVDKHNYFRIFSVKIPPNSEYVRIPSKKIHSLSANYNIGFSLAKTTAEILMNINKILTVKNKEVGEKERLSREYCKIYAWATNKLINHYEQKRFPWLEPLYNIAKASLTYAKGIAFLSFDKKTTFHIKSKQLDEFSKEFPPGSIVCKEGEKGEELYILRSGRLKVFIKGNPIAIIEDSGSVIGEMALLLGETRTATLQSIEHTVLTVVSKSNLKKFAETHPDFLRNISVDLSRRILANCTVVNDLSEIIDQSNKTDNSLPQVLREDKYKEELKLLRQSVKELHQKYDMDWLYDMYSEITDKIVKARES